MKTILIPKFLTIEYSDTNSLGTHLMCSVFQLLEDTYNEINNELSGAYVMKKQIFFEDGNYDIRSPDSTKTGNVLFLDFKKNTPLPSHYGNEELVWYPDIDDIDSILTMCVV